MPITIVAAVASVVRYHNHFISRSIIRRNRLWLTGMADIGNIVSGKGEGRGEEPALIPAATVVLVADIDAQLQTLMLRRNSKLDFAGGNWVFPGGRIDAADCEPGGELHDIAAARTAAIRETAEEAGLDIDTSRLTYFSHWVAPALLKKRFTTWFFYARVDAEQAANVRIDGGEIHEYSWLPPAEILARADRGEMAILPPTMVSLIEMANFDSVDALLSATAKVEPFTFQPRLFMGEGEDGRYVFMYQGDAGYETVDPDVPGPRHRLAFVDGQAVYEKKL